MRSVLRFLKDNKGQSEWNALYMILILGIVAVVLITLVKPAFKNSVKVSSGTEGVKTPTLKE